MAKSARRQAILVATITLCCGLSVVALLTHLKQRENAQELHESVAAKAEVFAESIKNRLAIYNYGLLGARGAIITAGQWGVSRNEFYRYSLTRDIDTEFPGAHGFGFIRRVAEAEEARFLQRAKADDKPDFAIRQLAPHAGDRYVIQYIEPEARNQAAIGLDIASEKNRREAALAAMHTGNPTLTAPITLAQMKDQERRSFLLLLPIYSGAVTPSNLSDREASLIGWSYAPLSMNEVLADLHIDHAQTRLTLTDITNPDDPQQFYQSDDGSLPIAYAHSIECDIYGRHWLITFSAHPAFVAKLNQVPARSVLLANGLFALLLAIFSGFLTSYRRQKQLTAAEHERLAAIVANSSDGIVGKTLDGVITSWNHGAELIFGFTAAQAVGRHLVDLIVPDALRDEEADILARLVRGEMVTAFETQRRRRDGNIIDVEVSVSPIRNTHGNVVGASKTVRDVTAQKAAKLAILTLNANLEQQVTQRTQDVLLANRRLSGVLDAATEISIIATDRAGNIRVFNTGAERMLGYRSAEIVDLCTPAVLHVAEEVMARGAELSAEYNTPIEGFRVFVHKPELQVSETREWTYVRKDGSRLPVSLTVTAVRDDAANVVGYLGIASDLTELQQQRNALMAANNQMSLATEVAELGVWSLDIAAETVQWNDRMFEIYGLPLSLRDEGLTLQSWSKCLHPDDYADAAGTIVKMIERRQLRHSWTVRIVTPNGLLRHLQARSQIIFDAFGQPSRIIGINRDITDQIELQTHLTDAKEQADAANAAKSSFLANMSHEIRTPMNAVLGMLQLVQKTGLDKRQRDYITKANSAAKSLLVLLNDILDYSKIEASKLELDQHVFELETLLHDLAIVLSGDQTKENVELIFNLRPTLPTTLIGDSLRLQQILINLAGNAIKFTSRGQVEVSIAELRRSSDRIELRIAVTDTGIGISPEQRTRIFDAFAQAEASTTRRFGGTGLGLVISQRLVALMGGTLQLESELGQGSKFWFDIALRIAPQAAPLLSTYPLADTAMRVLVVDDNPVGSEVLVRTMEEFGWLVEHIDNGHQAVQRAVDAAQRDAPYHAVFMDWHLPDLDGVSAAHQIRTNAVGAGQPPVIIMMTAHGSEALDDIQHGANPPFDALLIKPVTPRQISEAAQRALHGVRLAEKPAAPLSHPPQLAGRRVLVVEDNALNRQIAAELLAGEGAQVQLAEGGLDGVAQVLSGQQSFDVVIMDIQMPDIDGLEATRRIRSDPRFRDLPILAMTANVSPADRMQCLAAGMNDHIGKPIDLDELVLSLMALWNPPTDAAQSLQPVDRHDLFVAASATEELTTILRRFGGKIELFRSMLAQFKIESAALLDELTKQISQANWEGATAILHTLKGNAGTLGIRAAALRVVELERNFKAAATATKPHLLSASIITELKQQLATDIAQLEAASTQTEKPAVHIEAEPLAPELWQSRLAEILHLLESSNLQAIELVETLAAVTPRDRQAQFGRLFAQVESLDFIAAAATVRTFLKGA